MLVSGLYSEEGTCMLLLKRARACCSLRGHVHVAPEEGTCMLLAYSEDTRMRLLTFNARPSSSSVKILLIWQHVYRK